ncbi:cyclic nucleotide-binding domain-containing protein [Telmatospirillum sp. J64-1]|uniref:cyclic nucleotide-binding domain-containing protein n=1 Tax=Telmatospirillum sp. J64-1 TaxID=2502183 RepID=UPI00115EF9F6|nr:cyclic nucleotide-binding domain-containing protein [Telmatospirillum sp. J64-1]
MSRNAKVLDRKVFYAGQVVFKEGDEGDRAYLIQDGEVQISKNTVRGPVILGNLGKGELFGEMALIDDQPRMATATVLGTTTCVVINRMTFNEKLQSADPFVRGLLNIFVRNIRNLSK